MEEQPLNLNFHGHEYRRLVERLMTRDQSNQTIDTLYRAANAAVEQRGNELFRRVLFDRVRYLMRVHQDYEEPFWDALDDAVTELHCEGWHAYVTCDTHQVRFAKGHAPAA